MHKPERCNSRSRCFTIRPFHQTQSNEKEKWHCFSNKDCAPRLADAWSLERSRASKPFAREFRCFVQVLKEILELANKVPCNSLLHVEQ